MAASIASRVRRIKGWAPVLALAALTLAGVAAAVLLSPIFQVRVTTVTGESHLTEQEVLKAGGVHLGENELLLSTSAVRDSLLRNPWVADASVAKKLPSTLDIVVRERVPAASVRTTAGYALVSADGTTIESAQNDPGLPLITGVTPGDPGKKGESVAPLAAVAGAMDETVRSVTARLSLSTDGTVSIRLRHGPDVVFGPPTDVQAKVSALSSILQWAASSHTRLREIDVSAPDAPAATPISH